MHDMARTVVAEDGVELVFTCGREAAAAAFLVAVELLVPEVPAARTLVDVAANCSLVANLRSADLAARSNDRRVKPRNLRVGHQIDDSKRRTDLQSAIRRCHD